MKNKWLWITLIIVLILTGFFANWYFLMGPGKSEEAAESTQTEESEAIQEVSSDVEKTTKPVTASSIDTSTWETYKNEAYDFSFKYPKEWEVSTKDTGSEIYNVNILPKDNSSKGFALSALTSEDGSDYNIGKYIADIEQENQVIAKDEVFGNLQIKSIEAAGKYYYYFQNAKVKSSLMYFTFNKKSDPIDPNISNIIKTFEFN